MAMPNESMKGGEEKEHAMQKQIIKEASGSTKTPKDQRVPQELITAVERNVHAFELHDCRTRMTCLNLLVAEKLVRERGGKREHFWFDKAKMPNSCCA